ncbi:hypothetical protein LTR53_013684, partial [Teratosphaeriaceae sp. CCFEE 6253]
MAYPYNTTIHQPSLGGPGCSGGANPSRFDPSVPHFQPSDAHPRYLPTGLDLMPYTPPVPQMPQSLNAMEKYTLTTHLQHAHDLARMDYLMHRTHAELQTTNAAVGGDLRVLQRELEELRAEVRKAKGGDGRGGVLARGELEGRLLPGVHEGRIAPREVLLKGLSRETVADLDMDHAVEAEGVARRLRGGVEGVLGRDAREVQERKVEVQEVEGGEAKKAGPSAERTAMVSIGTQTTPQPAEPVERKIVYCSPDQANGDSNTTTDALPATTPKHKSDSAATAPAISIRQPLAVRLIAPTPVPSIPATHTQTFSWPLLTRELGGEKWAPGFYYIPSPPPPHHTPHRPSSPATDRFPCSAYWLLERGIDAFLPASPGQPGARLIPFADATPGLPGSGSGGEAEYQDVPLFIMDPEAQGGLGEYVYYGQYSQKRYSDRLSFDEVMGGFVGAELRAYWAETLADTARPAWITEALRTHFWPRPAYTGPLPTDGKVGSPTLPVAVEGLPDVQLEKHVLRGLAAYARELGDWDADARLK